MNTRDIVNEFSEIQTERRITIREAADWLGISFSHLSDIVSRRKNPSDRVAVKMVSFILHEKRTKSEQTG